MSESGYQRIVNGTVVDITDAEYAELRARVDQAVLDAVDTFERRRGIVDFMGHHDLDREAVHAEVRMIARWGARLALGLQRNPDREAES